MGGPLTSLLCVFPFPTGSKLRVPARTERPDCPDRRHLG